MALKHQFPKGFLWGTATAAHQVEGNNVNSDFWVLEHVPGTIVSEPSGDACDHYHRYREDIKLLAELGFKAYRFSIEWARVEPEKDMFSPAVIAHYRDVLNACHEAGLTPMVTLHHFTSPRWLMKLGGWTGAETPERFAKYTAYVIEQLGDLIPYICTLNEVNLPDLLAFIMGTREPASEHAPVGVQDVNPASSSWLQQAALAFGLDASVDIHPFPYTYINNGNFVETAMKAHQLARAEIKRLKPNIKVGFSLALHEIQSAPGGEAQAASMWETLFKQYLPILKDDDYFALQNYTREVVGPNGPLPVPETSERTQMGYEYYPEALGGVVRQVAADLHIPIIITENGIGTSDDTRRVEFIERALKGLHACIQDGIRVDGYFYWSAFDNYEWIMGFSKTFGLIAVDLKTQQRTVKPSAHYLGKIVKANGC